MHTWAHSHCDTWEFYDHLNILIFLFLASKTFPSKIFGGIWSFILILEYLYSSGSPTVGGTGRPLMSLFYFYIFILPILFFSFEWGTPLWWVVGGWATSNVTAIFPNLTPIPPWCHKQRSHLHHFASVTHSVTHNFNKVKFTKVISLGESVRAGRI